jgi:hypothetical protein
MIASWTRRAQARHVALCTALLGSNCSEPRPPYYSDSTGGRPAQKDSAAAPVSPVAGDDDTTPTGTPFAFCERAGAMPIDRLGILLLIAQHYDGACIQNCRTVGLLPDLDEERRGAWWDYLLNYSNALAGCPLIVTPLPGGITAFGPANTAAIGVSHPPLTREAAGLLIEQFVAAFGTGFGLAASERSEVEEYLWAAATAMMAIDASDWMSQCSADAGVSDGGTL